MSSRMRPVSEENQSTDLENAERLQYAADLLTELRTIAADLGCDTLAGILGLAHSEALRQSLALRNDGRVNRTTPASGQSGLVPGARSCR